MGNESREFRHYPPKHQSLQHRSFGACWESLRAFRLGDRFENFAASHLQLLSETSIGRIHGARSGVGTLQDAGGNLSA